MARKNSGTSSVDPTNRGRVVPGVTAMVAPQFEQFWKVQDAILEDAEAYSKAWFERRHDAAQSAMDALRGATGNGADPAAAMQTMVTWQQQSVRRMSDDMRQWLDLCTRCAARVTDAGIAAGKDTDDAPGGTGARPASTASPKQATPV